MNFTKYVSKILNRIKLMGKWVHLYRIQKGKTVLKKIKQISKEKDGNSNARIISYLRKIDPYVFEEMMLSVIEDSNIRVYRNLQYSGDGGIDGIFKLDKGKVLVQCKRYSNYINHSDVSKLAMKVKSDKYYLGLFVHTGKTGQQSKKTTSEHGNVIFLSGSSLVDVLVGKENIEKYIQHKEQFLKR